MLSILQWFIDLLTICWQSPLDPKKLEAGESHGMSNMNPLTIDLETALIKLEEEQQRYVFVKTYFAVIIYFLTSTLILCGGLISTFLNNKWISFSTPFQGC